MRKTHLLRTWRPAGCTMVLNVHASKGLEAFNGQTVDVAVTMGNSCNKTS